MNKKTLIAVALVAVLSVCSADATSDITGVTSGGSGSFDINPSKASGDVGFRYYDNFTLGQNDIANLIYQYQKSGGDLRDLNTFINLVGNKIDINGIVNTMRNGKFFDGHAVFISPKGMVVGASGVLNVGTLSVVTPTDDKFKELKTGYDSNEFKPISNISTLRNGAGMNYGGNAPVDIKGKIFTRGTDNNGSGVGVDIRGSQVDISGVIVNGYKGNNVFNTVADADALFNQLVNTDGTIKAGSNLIADKAGRVVIKSGKDVGAKKAGINIDGGQIINLGNTETAITNHGSNGLNIAGLVETNGKLNVYNNHTGSVLTVSGKLESENDSVSISSNKNINVNGSSKIVAKKDIEIVSNGNDTSNTGSGLFNFEGTAKANGSIHLVNNGAQEMKVSGTLGDANTKTVRIVNENGKLTFAGTATADQSVSIRNRGAQGMEVSGVAKANEGVYVENSAGNATLNGTLEAENVAIYNKAGAGKLATGTASVINGSNMVAIKNAGNGGMELAGTITNEGEVAINNLAGHATVGGTINNTGNMGIINKGNGTGLTVNGKITNEGKLKLVNSTGAEGLTVNGTVNNSTANLYIYNDAGHTTINGTLNNTEAGNLYVLSRANSTGITTGANSVISNEAGNLVIKHNGAGAKAGVGMDLNGTVKNAGGEIAINNYTGDMKVAGTITQEGNETIGIINRSANEDRAQTSKGGGAMTVNATVKGHDINIKNNGSGDMTVNGEITHDGRLNVLANEGNLIMGGKIHNTGKNMTYAASRANGDGVDVKSTFEADSTNGGLILIKNITGKNGLKYDGTMTSNGQAEIYNKVGDMTVNGNINARPAVILNTGDNMTVTDNANLQGDVKIVNKGSQKATVSDKYKKDFKEALK